MTIRPRCPGWALPAATFAAVFSAHLAWSGLFPPQDPCAAEAGASPRDWWTAYLASGGPWIGYSYAISLALAASALRVTWRRRSAAAGGVALGGLSLSGLLAAAGCWLTGCCGSPLLAVYLGLFGTALLPWAGPLVAGLATLSAGAGWWWLARRTADAPPPPTPVP